MAGKKWHFDVFDARSGRVRWNFDLENTATTDAPTWDYTGNRIALPLPSRGVWEVHRFPSGELLTTLPLVPGAGRGAFSPDGNTLYCVVGGVLYRQRAR